MNLLKLPSTISSRLGKKFLITMLLAGLIPLLVYSVPLYIQSYNYMRGETRNALEDFARMAGGQMFQLLKQGERRIINLAKTRENVPPEDDLGYFQSIERLESVDSLNEKPFAENWDPVSELKKMKGRFDQAVLLSPAFELESHVTVALLHYADDGAVWVGYVKPEIIWGQIRASQYEETDIVMVVDEENRILSTSREVEFSSLGDLAEYLPGADPEGRSGSGHGSLKGVGEIFWVNKRIWLEGAFGHNSWQVVVAREMGSVKALSNRLLKSLGLWFTVAFFGLIILAIRFSQGLYEPIQKLIDATDRLKEGDWSIAPVVHSGDELEDLAASFNSMREKIKETNERLSYNATHDTLTELPNRTLLVDRLERELNFAHRHEDYSFGVIFLDLDRFKMINDTLGHEAGDELLVEIAERLQKSNLRQTDTVHRIGGDEFVILAGEIESSDQARAIISKIERAVTDPVDIDGEKVSVGVSIGISIYEEEYQSADKMLSDADAAMYQAKNDPQDKTYVIFGERSQDQIEERFKFESDLRKAVDRDQLELRYQPVMDLKASEMVGAEVLVRWNHPEKGIVSPSDFIPGAEEIGCIRPIGSWVLEKSVDQLKDWQCQSGPIRWLSLNISSQQLVSDQLFEKVESLLKEPDVNPNGLKLEITENILVANVNHSTELLNKLRDCGVSVCIDDFGTGHSSMSVLCDLPVDVLKIDKSFTAEINENRDRQAVVSAILSLAKKMGLEVVVEGIETRYELNYFTAVNCRYGQGFYFAQPLTAGELERFSGLSKSRVVSKSLG